MEIIDLIRQIPSILTAGKSEIILKIVLFFIMGFGYIWYKVKAKKIAKQQSDKIKNETMSELPEENTKIEDEANKVESKIDDLLGD